MLKHLTIASCIALLSACTVVSDDSASASNSSTATDTAGTTASGTTSGTTTDAPTTANPTTGTTTDAPTTGATTTGTTTDAPTTGATTTEDTTGGGSISIGTTGGDTGTTGGDTGTTGGVVGCGWAMEGYYACADMGGEADAVDPMMMDPIACPQDIMEDAACNDMGMGPIGTVGCCAPGGLNYFCNQGKVFLDDCNME